MRCNIFLLFAAFNLAFGMDSSVQNAKNLFQNFSFCNIPFNKEQFDRKLMELTTLRKNFVDLVLGIKFHSTTGTETNSENFKCRLLFLTALLKNPDSSLCIALLEDPFSYTSHLMKTYSSYQDEANSTDFPSGQWMFEEVFMKDVFWEEIAQEFKINPNLKNFHFPSHNDALLKTDVMQLRSTAGQREQVYYAMIEAVFKRIDEYVSLMSAFHQILPTTDHMLFENLILLLSGRCMNSKFYHYLLFRPANPLSRWIIDNYATTIKLKKKAFISAYLDFLFNPEIYRYIFGTFKSFVWYEKIRLLFVGEAPKIVKGSEFLKSLIFQNFSLFFLLDDDDLWVKLAYLSLSSLDFADVSPKIQAVFNFTYSGQNSFHTCLNYFVLFLMINWWIKDNKMSVVEMNRIDALKLFADFILILLNQNDAEAIRNYLIECLFFILKTDFKNIPGSSSDSKLGNHIMDRELKCQAKMFLAKLLQLKKAPSSQIQITAQD